MKERERRSGGRVKMMTILMTERVKEKEGLRRQSFLAE